jgi:DNA-binding NarL/FixJ family response regulator
VTALAALGWRRSRSARNSVASRILGSVDLGEDTVVRALIVDDHPSFRATARALLESEGYEVVGEAASATAALAAAEQARPEFVLVDIQLPDLDGFELAERLVRLDAGVQIVLTSSRDIEDYGRCLDESVAKGFLPKAELSGPRLAALLA